MNPSNPSGMVNPSRTSQTLQMVAESRQTGHKLDKQGIKQLI